MFLKSFKATKIACYTGFIVQAIGVNFAPLLFIIFNESLGVSLEKITLLVTVNFALQLAIDATASFYVDRLGYRTCMLIAHFTSFTGLVGLGLLPFIMPDPFVGLLISVCLYAVGNGLIEVLVSPIIEACPSDNKAAQMSLLHSFYSWGSAAVILLTTLFLLVFGKASWRVLAFIWALVPLVNAFVFIKVPINKLTTEEDKMPLKELFSQKAFWLFLIIMACSGATELSMGQWASAFAEAGLGVSKVAGDLAGPLMFAVFMGISRTFYGKIGHRIKLESYMPVCAVMCLAAYAITVFIPSPMVALAGCGLCGLSAGIMWPGTLSLASGRFPKGGTAMFALLALGGDAGCVLGPTLVGMISSRFGDNLKIGLGAAMAFPLLLIICTLIYRAAGKKLTGKKAHKKGSESVK